MLRGKKCFQKSVKQNETCCDLATLSKSPAVLEITEQRFLLLSAGNSQNTTPY
jgi:hypothetical protein